MLSALLAFGSSSQIQTHADLDSPALFDKIRDGLFSNYAPFDVCVTLVMPDIETWVQFKADYFFKQSVGPDHARFADTKRSQMMLGWYTPLITDGQLMISTGNHHNPQPELELP